MLQPMLFVPSTEHVVPHASTFTRHPNAPHVDPGSVVQPGTQRRDVLPLISTQIHPPSPQSTSVTQRFQQIPAGRVQTPSGPQSSLELQLFVQNPPGLALQNCPEPQSRFLLQREPIGAGGTNVSITSSAAAPSTTSGSVPRIGVQLARAHIVNATRPQHTTA